MPKQVTEWKGCEKLVYAELITDTAEAFETGEVKDLAPVQEINNSTEVSSETKFYDNAAALVMTGEGGETVNFICGIPSDEVLADIAGRVYDTATKTFLEVPRKNKYFAVGYIYNEITASGEQRVFVWKYKGTFGIPEETHVTKDDGTDSNNITLPFTSIFTTHVFKNGEGAGKPSKLRGIRRRESAELNEDAFFASVVTPDTENA